MKPLPLTGGLLLSLQLMGMSLAHSAPLPPSCASVTVAPDLKTPLKELHKKVEMEEDTDPTAAFALMCATVPRVERERGAQSPELAWWMASMATPLIAYMDKFDEALPVLKFAQPILEKRYGRYGEPLGDIHVAYAWTYFRQGHLAEAAAAWEEALKVRERTPGPMQVELQKVLVGLAQVQLSQRNFAAAQVNLERAKASLAKYGDPVSDAGAAIENALLNVAIRQEDFVAARAHAEEQIRIEDQMHNGAAQLIPPYALLGTILERMNDYDGAEQAVRHAMELSESTTGPLQRHHVSALYQLAVLLQERGRSAEAHDYAVRALALAESTLGPKAPRLVSILDVLGDTERSLGDFAPALVHFERAGTLVAAGAKDMERPWLVNYYHDVGDLQITLGDLTQADQSLAAGLEAAGTDPTLSVARARLLLDRGRAATERGTAESRDDLLQAATLLRSRLPETHPAILRVINELCALDLTEASGKQENCTLAAEHLANSPEAAPAVRSAVRVNLSRQAMLHKDSTTARVEAIRALVAAETSGTPDALWQADLQVALALREGGQKPEAIFFGKQAVEQIEQERHSLGSADQQYELSFLRDKVAAYRAVADWLMEAGRLDEGLAMLQLMKREELSDFGVRDASMVESQRVELTDEESTLLKRYLGATQADAGSADEVARLSQLEEAGHIMPSEQAHLKELLAGRADAESSRIERLEALLQPQAMAATGTQGPVAERSTRALAQQAQAFGKDTAFAVYLLAEDHLRVLVSARGHQQEFVTALNAGQIQQDIGKFLDDISHHRDTTAESDHLYGLMLKQVDDFAAANHVHRLTLWLDGAMRYVPVAALRDGQRYLLDKYVIQIYSPASSAEWHAAASGKAPQVRGLGVTKAVAGFPALPAVADELCFVVDGPIEGLSSSDGACPSPSRGQGALVGEGFADSAFTEARLRQVLATPGSFSVLHIGTHFRLRPGNALRSYLLLGDGSQLTLDTISSLNFQGVDLVTLSACQTGLGGARNDDGREVEGLSTLVQRRGAREVIASLWPVEDTSTAQLMRALYGSFARNHGDAALGLQLAQRALRSQGPSADRSSADPYYWAGFFVASSHP